MIYRLKYAKSESNFDADFEHPTLQGALLIAIVPRALPWAKSFCPFRACGAKTGRVGQKTCEPSVVCASPQESRFSLSGLIIF